MLLTAAMHHGPQTLDVHVFHQGLTDAETSGLRRTLEGAGKPFHLSVVPFDPAEWFRRFIGLHGSQMTYGRLLLPQLLPHHRRVLYLDSDLLIRTDLQQVFESDLGGHPLGAVAANTFAHSLDARLAVSKGLPGNTPHFNAGVLLLDLDQWRNHSLTDRCMAFATKNSLVLRSHDQTVLNFVFTGSFKSLSRRLNVCVEPWNRQIPGGAAILHFIGSPKPFDSGARWLHAQRGEFESWLRMTAIWQQNPPLRRILTAARRLWHTRRSIARCLLHLAKPEPEPLPLPSFDTEYWRRR